MSHRFLLLLALLANLPVAAETPAPDSRNAARDHVQALLQAQPGAEAECSQVSTNQTEAGACLQRLQLQASQDRKTAEQAAMAMMKQLDTVQQRSDAVPALQKDIKAFNLYRTAHCNWVASTYGSGNGRDKAQLACLIDLDRARAHELSVYFTR